ncbi:hypothetical protein FHR32_006105 [Streptosporangium album]|uniref:Threonine dehydrogenase n=1 Tax=Streptosporangium album TaxID=47479 RepID=A0A7W7WCD3_9ACTN|nr:hypothetical protein [Streptosporangium album]MBB4941728.1 hypothetical protein [Streptosporangium album]
MSVEAARPLACRYAGPRIRLTGGQAHLQPASAVPAGMLRARFSVLSPGTERRHLHATEGPDGSRDAGYMTLGGDHSAGWVLAAVPRGASFDVSSGGTVTAPPGTRVQAAAVARFQQMAVLGLDRLPVRASLDDVVVVGSGPVALGCALELRRRGACRVRVLTSRPQAPISLVPGVECVTTVERGSAGLVVDAVGAPRQAARLLTLGGLLGLLGTPDPGSVLPPLSLHRAGWTVVGIHELIAVATPRYRDAYTASAAWLNRLAPDLVDAWCRIVPGELATGLYACLGGPRPAEPVVIFSWESS